MNKKIRMKNRGTNNAFTEYDREDAIQLSDDQLKKVSGGKSDDSPVCPECGSRDVFHYYIAQVGFVYECRNCNYSWG